MLPQFLYICPLILSAVSALPTDCTEVCTAQSCPLEDFGTCAGTTGVAGPESLTTRNGLKYTGFARYSTPLNVPSLIGVTPASIPNIAVHGVGAPSAYVQPMTISPDPASGKMTFNFEKFSWAAVLDTAQGVAGVPLGSIVTVRGQVPGEAQKRTQTLVYDPASPTLKEVVTLTYKRPMKDVDFGNKFHGVESVEFVDFRAAPVTGFLDLLLNKIGVTKRDVVPVALLMDNLGFSF
ncbi:hypothetical protein EJ08DRAFT_732675 [Tothia fuscella]|uniref:Uncharacterized protein n=1 Tax=Tothia fuscella TaxID=1048955 RepID=A0A9P4NVQ5_9PEZI|nr:hypothetical protein EJ08DRAFT_732675 [Tothia fuscella]